MAKARRKPGGGDILEQALALAEADGWETFSMRRLAAACGLSMAELRARYRDPDAVADAWFRTAQDAMLAPTGRRFAGLPAKERLRVLMLRWFDALAPHRRVTAAMLRGKLWLYHPHHYVPMVFHCSRLIQSLRDAAGLDAGGRRRQVEEVGLTALFLATLAVWCRDASDGQDRTRRFLDRRLAQADTLMARSWPPRKRKT